MHQTDVAQRGFTLVEVVLVMVITGILAGMVALFIRLPVQNYVDAANRAELTDAADLALRRMTREIRLALPNSLRISTDAAGRTALEFLLTKTGGRYWAVEDNVAGDFLSFTDPSDRTFDVVGSMPSGRQKIVVNDFLVVYNLGPGVIPADAYDCSASCSRIGITGVAGNKLTLAANLAGAQSPAMASPTMRFQVVSTPVTYDCNGAAGGAGKLTRYSNYTIAATQSNPPADPAMLSATLTNNVLACTFTYDTLVNTRSALVGLTLTLQVPGASGGSITLVQQIHVDSTP